MSRKRYSPLGLLVLLAAFFAALAVISPGAESGVANAQTRADWTPLDSGTTRILYDVDFVDENTGWAVGAGGTILRTASGGAIWTAQSSGTTVDLYAVDFIDASNGWAVGESGNTLRTTDGGASWTRHYGDTAQWFQDVHFIDANTGWAVATAGRVARTTDGGVTWSSSSSGTGASLYGVHFIDANTGWAVGNSGVIRHTTDGGANWSARTNVRHSDGSLVSLRGVVFLDANNGWVVGSRGTIAHTSDGGTTWTSQSSRTSNWLSDVQFVDADTGWAVGANGTIVRTTDGGANWTAQNSGTTQHLQSVHVIDADSARIVGNAGTILAYGELPPHWRALTSGTNRNLYAVHFADAYTGWAAGSNGTVRRTNNGGASWSAQSLGTTITTPFGMDFIDASNGWAVGSNNWISHTTDGGANWTRQTSGVFVTLWDVDFVDANNGWVVGFHGTIIRTSDGGANWTRQTSGTSRHLYGVQFVDASNGWAVGANGTILRTANGGATWSAQTSGTTRTLNGVEFTDASNGWAVGAGGTILRTSNGGATWSAQSSGTSQNLWGVEFTDASNGWAVGRNGTILRTTNGGVNWRPQDSGTTQNLWGVHFIDADTGWAVGDNGTILAFGDPPPNLLDLQLFSQCCVYEDGGEQRFLLAAYLPQQRSEDLTVSMSYSLGETADDIESFEVADFTIPEGWGWGLTHVTVTPRDDGATEPGQKLTVTASVLDGAYTDTQELRFIDDESPGAPPRVADVYIYHDPSLGDPERSRYEEAVALLDQKGVSHRTVSSDHATVDGMTTVHEPELPWYFRGDPTAEGWQDDLGRTHGHSRWLRNWLLYLLPNTPGLAVTPASLEVGEDGGAGTYTVKLHTEPSGTVTVSLSSSDTGAATVSPSTLTFTTRNWPMPQTVTVTGVNDDVDNPGNRRTATISHAAAGGGYGSVSTATVSVTVRDDDHAQDPPDDVTGAAPPSDVEVYIYHDASLGDAERNRYDTAITLLNKKGVTHHTVSSNRDTVDDLTGLRGSVMPRFFRGDPTAEGWESNNGVTHGGLRWLRGWLLPMPDASAELTGLTVSGVPGNYTALDVSWNRVAGATHYRLFGPVQDRIRTGQTSYRFENVETGTHTVRVEAWTAAAKLAEAQATGSTDEASLDLSAYPSATRGTTVIVAEWTTSYHGEIDHHIVRWKAPYSQEQSFRPDPDQVFGFIRNGIPVRWYSITGLNPGTPYDITVEAYDKRRNQVARGTDRAVTVLPMSDDLSTWYNDEDDIILGWTQVKGKNVVSNEYRVEWWVTNEYRELNTFRCSGSGSSPADCVFNASDFASFDTTRKHDFRVSPIFDNRYRTVGPDAEVSTMPRIDGGQFGGPYVYAWSDTEIRLIYYDYQNPGVPHVLVFNSRKAVPGESFEYYGESSDRNSSHIRGGLDPSTEYEFFLRVADTTTRESYAESFYKARTYTPFRNDAHNNDLVVNRVIGSTDTLEVQWVNRGDVDTYRVQWKLDSGGGWLGTHNAPGNASSHTITGLEENTGYTVRVTLLRRNPLPANIRQAEGDYAKQVFVEDSAHTDRAAPPEETDADHPLKLGALIIAGCSDSDCSSVVPTGISFIWTGMESVDGTEVAKYRFQMSSDGNNWVFASLFEPGYCGPRIGTDTSCFLILEQAGISAGETWHFRVLAYSAGDPGSLLATGPTLKLDIN